MKNHRKDQKGMALGLALVAILVIGIMIAMFLQRNKSDRDQVQMDSGRRVLLSKANATYDFLMDATVTAFKEYTNKCSSQVVLYPNPSNRPPVNLQLRDNLGQAAVVSTPCPGTSSNLQIDPGLWGKIQALVKNPEATSRFKCLKGCVDYKDFPKMIVMTIEQREDKNLGFYASVSGRFELVEGSVSEFSVGAFAIEWSKNAKIINGVHGDVAFFFKPPPAGTPPIPPTCAGGTQTNPILNPSTVYMIPPAGTQLVIDSISTNVAVENLCMGFFTQHQWGPNWAQAVTNFGDVTVKKGAVLTSSFFPEYKQQLLNQYSSGIGSTYNSAFSTWYAAHGGGGGAGGTGETWVDPFQYLNFGLSPSLGVVLGVGIGGGGVITTGEGFGSSTSVYSVGMSGSGGGTPNPQILSATLELGGCGSDPSQCRYRLTETFRIPVNGNTTWVVAEGIPANNTTLYTKAPVVYVQKWPGDTANHATIGINNLYLFAPGDIRLKESVVQHPAMASVLMDDPSAQGHLALVTTGGNVQAGSDFVALTGDTLGAIAQNSSFNQTTPTVAVEAGMITASDTRAPFELVNGLLTPPASGTKKIGTANFKGPIWGAYQTMFRKMDDSMQNVVTGFSDVTTEYPSSWRSDPKLSIKVSTLPMARDLGRTFDFIDYSAALKAARTDLGLPN